MSATVNTGIRWWEIVQKGVTDRRTSLGKSPMAERAELVAWYIKKYWLMDCTNCCSAMSETLIKSKVNKCIAVSNNLCLTATGNSHDIWDHTVLPATRQRWESRLYPQPKQVLDLATPEGCKAELTYVMWKRTGRELNPWPVSRKSKALLQCHHVTQVFKNCSLCTIW